MDRENTPEMAMCLSGLLQDVERRQAIGRAGFERYTAEFTAERHAERFRAVLMDQLELN